MNREPVAWAAAVQTLIVAIASFGESFDWWHLTDAQRGSLTGLWIAFVAVITIVVRSKVTPTDTP